jgi:hypothetical protein
MVQVSMERFPDRHDGMLTKNKAPPVSEMHSQWNEGTPLLARFPTSLVMTIEKLPFTQTLLLVIDLLSLIIYSMIKASSPHFI